jgi:hypothetical protein
MRIDRRHSGGILVLRDSCGGGGALQRSFGLVALLGGSVALQHLVRAGGWANCNDLCGVGIAAAFAFGGLFTLANFDDVRLDLVNRTYVRRFGPWPLHSCRRGSFGEIEAIRICFEPRSYFRGGEGGVSGTVQVTVVTLRWKEQVSRPLRISEQKVVDALWGNSEDGFAEANSLSRLIGIPLVDFRRRT